ncbi:hypothetical protein AGMMS50268_24020 [Spirochaetia bacterium]|nr:hypothetical protein AGMMS50268_24020 [Spirochaetia bacterium]
MRWNVSGLKTTPPAGAPARLMGLFLLCSVLSWVLPLPVYSLDGEADGNGSSSGNELERLIGISERLESFAAYRQTAELRIAGLERSRGIYRIAFFTAAGLALGGVIVGVAGMSR